MAQPKTYAFNSAVTRSTVQLMEDGTLHDEHYETVYPSFGEWVDIMYGITKRLSSSCTEYRILSPCSCVEYSSGYYTEYWNGDKWLTSSDEKRRWRTIEDWVRCVDGIDVPSASRKWITYTGVALLGIAAGVAFAKRR